MVQQRFPSLGIYHDVVTIAKVTVWWPFVAIVIASGVVTPAAAGLVVGVWAKQFVAATKECTHTVNTKRAFPLSRFAIRVRRLVSRRINEKPDWQEPDMTRVNVCAVKECPRSVAKRGYCNMHYLRLKRTGDVGEAAPRAYPGLPAVERFWFKVDRDGPIHPRLGTPCWLWTAGKFNTGYGSFKDGHARSDVLAHRFSNQLAVSQTMFAPWMPLPSEIEIDHRCHVPECVNPQHLRAATRKQQSEHLGGPMRTSKSGVRGVWWDKRRNRWVAEVTHNGRKFCAGTFTDLADAEAAVIAKRLKLFTRNDVDRFEAGIL